MTLPFAERSVVAIDPTTKGLAYVFFEHGEFMDAAIRGTGTELGEIIAALNDILEGTAADVLVLENADDPACRRHARIKHVLREIARHTRKRGVPVLLVSREDVRQSWRANGFKTKEAAAREIARRFPDLERYVPPLRKYPADENRNVNLFDAASLALHAFPSDS